MDIFSLSFYSRLEYLYHFSNSQNPIYNHLEFINCSWNILISRCKTIIDITGTTMDTKILTAIILIIVVIVLAYSPFYKKYQLFYLNKVGYWDILIQFLVIAGINFFIGLKYGLGALFLLIVPVPLDIIFLISMIYSYFRIRKLKCK